MSQQQHKGPFNYTTKHAKHTGTTTSGPGVGLSGSRQMPDRTIHHPPIAMYFIGGGAVLFVRPTKLCEIVSPLIAVWLLAYPPSAPVHAGHATTDVVKCAHSPLT